MRTSILGSALGAIVLAAAPPLASVAHAQEAGAPVAPAVAAPVPPAPSPAAAPAAPVVAPPPGAVAAAAPLPPLRFYATTGWEYGTNELLTVQLDDGSTKTMRLNGGFRLALGAAFLPLRGGAFETRATVGVKYDWLSADNGSVRYLAFPVELLEAWNAKPLRLSAGISMLLAPSVKGKEVLAPIDLDLRNSLGLVGQIEWVLPFQGVRGSVSVGLRFTWQKLELDQGGPAEDANAVGGIVGVTL